MKTATRVNIPWMIRYDLTEVLRIENESFEYAWNEEDFLRCLRVRNCIGMSAKHGEKVVGYFIYELHKHSLHILNFAVHPQHRHESIGAQMIAKLTSKLSSYRRSRITADVRESNLPAQLFFKSQGFTADQILPGFYEDSAEDAYRFVYRHRGEREP